MKQGIIFDMDGTLWDSADGVAKSWTQVIQNEYKKDMTVTEQDIKRVMGKTKDVIGDIFFPELSALEGDRGGKRVIRAHPEALFTVLLPEEELFDTDTKEELQRLKKV